MRFKPVLDNIFKDSLSSLDKVKNHKIISKSTRNITSDRLGISLLVYAKEDLIALVSFTFALGKAMMSM